MRIKKLLCTLITISLLSTNINISTFASELPQQTKTEESTKETEVSEESQSELEKISNTETSDNKETPDTETSNIEPSNTEAFETETSDNKETPDTETSDIENSNDSSNTEEITDEQTTDTNISSEEISSEELTDTEDASTEIADISIINDNLSVEAANGLGNLLMDELQIAAQEGQSEAQASYAITEIEMSGKTAQVSLHISSPCTVVVSIYKENSNKPLGFGSVTAEIGESKINVPIEIESMPEYFIVKGHIVESTTLRPLSKEYESGMYTQKMQEFLKKTTADFDSEKVLNLDDDEKTNFIVINDNNTLIKTSKDTNNNDVIINEFIGYNETDNTYTFQNIDEQIKNLKKNNIFVYSDNHTNVLFTIKIMQQHP